MSKTARKGSLPLAAMVGAGALMGFTMLVVGIGRSESVGLTRLPTAEIVSTVDFRVADVPDGSIAMREAGTDRLLLTIHPGEDNFMRATMRGLAQARQRAGLGREAPFSLTRYDNGTLSLDDGATGRKIPLEAFGRPNALAFARLLPGDAGTPR
ncbi:MAG: photosynthetic complex assembly protein PuhC [Methylobacterium sp.]